MDSQAPAGTPPQKWNARKPWWAISPHPFFFASLFILQAYKELIPFSNPGELIRVLLVVIGLVLVVQFTLAFLIRQPFKAGIAGSVLVVFCCSFGKVLSQCAAWCEGTNWSFLCRARTLLVIEAAVYLVLFVKLARTRRDLCVLNRYLNVLGVILVLATGAAILFSRAGPAPTVSERALTPLHGGTNSPDIYYILSDARTSPESLQSYWNYDDSAFVQFLTGKGFRVIKNAHGNATATPICLATYLNMDYPPMGEGVQYAFGRPAGTAYYTWLIQHAEVPARLKASGYDVTNLSIFAVGDQPRFYYFPKISSSTLACCLWESSALGHLFDYQILTSLADRNLKVLSLLPQIAAQRTGRPKFVYSHLIMPHQPFLFDQEGHRILRGMKPSDWRPELYLGQLIYENTLLTNTITAILKNSPQPPIIVLQGDHGFRFLPGPNQKQEATTILNALYLPGSTEKWLYPGLTPVNTFRLIFNHYFGEHYDYLSDISRVTSGTDEEK